MNKYKNPPFILGIVGAAAAAWGTLLPRAVEHISFAPKFTRDVAGISTVDGKIALALALVVGAVVIWKTIVTKVALVGFGGLAALAVFDALRLPAASSYCIVGGQCGKASDVVVQPGFGLLLVGGGALVGLAGFIAAKQHAGESPAADGSAVPQ